MTTISRGTERDSTRPSGRPRGEIDPGARAMVVAVAVLVLLGSLAAAARGLRERLGRAGLRHRRRQAGAIALPSRLFVWFAWSSASAWLDAGAAHPPLGAGLDRAGGLVRWQSCSGCWRSGRVRRCRVEFEWRGPGRRPRPRLARDDGAHLPLGHAWCGRARRATRRRRASAAIAASPKQTTAPRAAHATVEIPALQTTAPRPNPVRRSLSSVRSQSLTAPSAASAHSRHCLACARACSASLLLPVRVGLGGLLLELRDPLTELRGTGEGLRVGATPLPTRRRRGPASRRRAAGLRGRACARAGPCRSPPTCPAVAQCARAAVRVRGRVDARGAAQQGFLGRAFSSNSASRSAIARVARGEEHVLRALEPLPQLVVGFARRPAGGLPLGEQVAELAAVAPQSVESAAPRRARPALPCGVLAVARSRSSSAKWAPRRRLNASRALEYRFHKSVVDLAVDARGWTSTRRGSRGAGRPRPSTGWTRHRSARPRRRALPCVRCCSCALLFLLVLGVRGGLAPTRSMMICSRAESASTSPITAAVGRDSAALRPRRLVFLTSPAPEASRASSSATSVARSSKRRPKWARPSAASPACQEPMHAFALGGLHPGGAVFVDAAELARVAGRHRGRADGSGR